MTEAELQKALSDLRAASRKAKWERRLAVIVMMIMLLPMAFAAPYVLNENLIGAGTYSSSIASASNAFAVLTNGARVDFGAGASDHAISDGTTVAFAGPLQVVGTTIIGDTTTPKLTLSNAVGSKLEYGVNNFLLLNNRFSVATTEADSATAIATAVDTAPALTVPGSLLQRWSNGGANKAVLDKDGFLSTATPHPVGLGFVGGKQNGSYLIQTTADVLFTAVALPTAAVAGTASAAPVPGGGIRKYIQHASLAVSGNAGGIVGPYTETRSLYRPRLSAVMLTDATVNLRRVWVALSESSLTAEVVPTASVASAVDFIGLAFDTAISANWACCSGDGTNKSCSDTGVSVLAQVEYRLVVDYTTSGTLRCCVGGICVNKTTLLPIGATDFGIHNAATTLQAVAANHLVSITTLEQN